MKKAAVLLMCMALASAAAGCSGAGEGNTPNAAAVQAQMTEGRESAGDELTVSGNSRDAETALQNTDRVQNGKDLESGDSSGESGVLIVYFSVPEDVDISGVDAVAGASIVVRDGEKMGNTEYVAELIRETIGGDMFRIETVDGYPLDHDPLVDQAADEQDEDARPQLASHIENLDQYETILLGYPNWWGDLPMPLYSFLEEYDFGGKTVIPFVTHGGSGASRTIDTISELEPEAQIYEDALVISRNDVADSAKTVTDWAKGLALQERSQEALLQETAVLETAAASSAELPFPLGQRIESDSFTGNAYIEMMIADDETYHFPQTNHLTFEPGARSSWHSHGGMVLLITGGKGFYQEEGKPAQILRPGDVVDIEPGVKHWHGAAPDSWFSQIVIFDSHYVPEEGAAPLEEPVTDEQYNNLETQEYTGRRVKPDDMLMFQRAEQAAAFDTFSGLAYVSSLIGADNAAGAPDLHYVVFEPGVINNWHTHEGGQILIATDGIGYHQMEGEPVQVLYPGDVALCPPGVKHWHGGSADASFGHIAVNTNPELAGLTWFDRITEEEYAALPAEKDVESDD